MSCRRCWISFQHALELLRRIKKQDAELLEYRDNTAGIAPTLHQQVFDDFKEAKRLHQETVDELKEVKQLLLEAQQDVDNWRADAMLASGGRTQTSYRRN